MADQTFQLAIQQRGGAGNNPVVQQFPFGANAWTKVELVLKSPTEFNAASAGTLVLGYSARVSLDGGSTWEAWGGMSITNPARDRSGNIIPLNGGGIWNWKYNAGGIIEVTVNCPVRFAWGADLILHDV